MHRKYVHLGSLCSPGRSRHRAVLHCGRLIVRQFAVRCFVIRRFALGWFTVGRFVVRRIWHVSSLESLLCGYGFTHDGLKDSIPSPCEYLDFSLPNLYLISLLSGWSRGFACVKVKRFFVGPGGAGLQACGKAAERHRLQPLRYRNHIEQLSHAPLVIHGGGNTI